MGLCNAMVSRKSVNLVKMVKMENAIILPIYDDYVERKAVYGDENDVIPFDQNWRNWQHFVIGGDSG